MFNGYNPQENSGREKPRITSDEVQSAVNMFTARGGIIRKLPDQVVDYIPVIGEDKSVYVNVRIMNASEPVIGEDLCISDRFRTLH